MYPNETTRAYIGYRKTISTQTVAERCKIYAWNSQNCDFNQTLHARVMTHYTKLFKELDLFEFTVKINLRHCSRVIYNCATLKSKDYRRDNVIQKEAKP